MAIGTKVDSKISCTSTFPQTQHYGPNLQYEISLFKVILQSHEGDFCYYVDTYVEQLGEKSANAFGLEIDESEKHASNCPSKEDEKMSNNGHISNGESATNGEENGDNF